ncbi:MAG: minor capsid protein, partial [Porticoccus sp.]
IMTDPSKINIFTSKAFTEDNFREFGAGKFSLTATQGAAIRLPNGTTVSKAFRGIAESSVEKLDLAVRSGVFAGESLDQITRRLVGRLEFADFGPLSVKQLALAGGELTKIANNQISTIVRTSVNQVTNQASQAVYAANKKVSPRYEYVATLDSRTSPICQRLDGQRFDYNNGPTPPQHFNCRSTTVPVVDFDGLQKKYPNLEKPLLEDFDELARRPSQTGRVPSNLKYGNWIFGQRKGQFGAGEIQIKTFGSKRKAEYFNRLAQKEGPVKALRTFVRNDGSTLTLDDLRNRYGSPQDIISGTDVAAGTVTIVDPEKANRLAAAAKASIEKADDTGYIPTGEYGTEEVDKYLNSIGRGYTAEKLVQQSLDNLESAGGRIAANTKKMRKFMKKSKTLNHFNMRSEQKQWNRSMTDKIPLKAYREQMESTTKAFEKFPNSADNKTNMRWYQGIKNATDDGRQSLIHSSMYDVMQPAPYGVAGYTATPTSIVNTELRNFSNPLGKSAVKKFTDASQKALKDYTGTMGDLVGGDHQWLATMIHETGHQVHFKGSGAAPLGVKFKKLGGKSSITIYSEKDKFELFAESFAAYVTTPDTLLEDAPRLYNWVEETLNAALDYL